MPEQTPRPAEVPAREALRCLIHAALTQPTESESLEDWQRDAVAHGLESYQWPGWRDATRAADALLPSPPAPGVEDGEPSTPVPNRLLALLVGADRCEHAADYCCHDCMTKAMDRGLALLENPDYPSPPAPGVEDGPRAEVGRLHEANDGLGRALTEARADIASRDADRDALARVRDLIDRWHDRPVEAARLVADLRAALAPPCSLNRDIEWSPYQEAP